MCLSIYEITKINLVFNTQLRHPLLFRRNRVLLVPLLPWVAVSPTCSPRRPQRRARPQQHLKVKLLRRLRKSRLPPTATATTTSRKPVNKSRQLTMKRQLQKSANLNRHLLPIIQQQHMLLPPLLRPNSSFPFLFFFSSSVPKPVM